MRARTSGAVANVGDLVTGEKKRMVSSCSLEHDACEWSHDYAPFVVEILSVAGSSLDTKQAASCTPNRLLDSFILHNIAHKYTFI